MSDSTQTHLKDRQALLATAHPNRLVSKILDSLKKYLTEEYQERLDQIILFGSYAREDATNTSDDFSAFSAAIAL